MFAEVVVGWRGLFSRKPRPEDHVVELQGSCRTKLLDFVRGVGCQHLVIVECVAVTLGELLGIQIWVSSSLKMLQAWLDDTEEACAGAGATCFFLVSFNACAARNFSACLRLFW